MTEDSVRHPRGFEPPPWEAEQFEQLARQRAADDEAQRRLTAASRAAAQKQAAEGATAAGVAATGATGVAATGATGATGAAGPARADAAATGRPRAAPSIEAEADVMLLSLRAEEPPPLRNAWIVTMVAGVPIILMGLVMAVLGAYSALGGKVTTGERPLVSGLFLEGALGLLILGGWLVAKSLKTRSIGG